MLDTTFAPFRLVFTPPILTHLPYCAVRLKQEKKLQFENRVRHIMSTGSRFFKDVDSKRRGVVGYLEDVSQEVFRSFMNVFGADGSLRSLFSVQHAITSPDESCASRSCSSDSELVESALEPEFSPNTLRTRSTSTMYVLFDGTRLLMSSLFNEYRWVVVGRYFRCTLIL